MNFNKYKKTAELAFRGKTNGGVVYLLPTLLVKLIYLLPLLVLWRVLAESGVEVGMTLPQLLRYTYLNALLGDLLVVRTFVSEWCYNGELVNLYQRPYPIFGQIIAETAGGWVPMLLLWALPMALLAPLFGVSMLPDTLWFFPSLFLCVSLGFAVDMIFSCVTIRLGSMSWLGYSIRMAVVSLFSGSVIPFRVMPFGLEQFFQVQPFGSLGGAPLSLFVGTGESGFVIGLQLFWNAVCWMIAIIWFKKSKERQVSFGG